jgi:hypothetical protein
VRTVSREFFNREWTRMNANQQMQRTVGFCLMRVVATPVVAQGRQVLIFEKSFLFAFIGVHSRLKTKDFISVY